MSYIIDCESGDWESVRLAGYIAREKNLELKEALIDLDEFLFG